MGYSHAVGGVLGSVIIPHHCSISSPVSSGCLYYSWKKRKHHHQVRISFNNNSSNNYYYCIAETTPYHMELMFVILM